MTFGVRFSIDYATSSAEEESTTFAVAPCSEVTATATRSNVDFSGTMTVLLRVSGMAHFKVKYKDHWFGWGSTDYYVEMDVSVDGTYSGTTGQSISVGLEQRRAKCEGDCKKFKVGQALTPGTTEKSDTGSSDAPPGEQGRRKNNRKRGSATRGARSADRRLCGPRLFCQGRDCQGREETRTAKAAVRATDSLECERLRYPAGHSTDDVGPDAGLLAYGRRLDGRQSPATQPSKSPLRKHAINIISNLF